MFRSLTLLSLVSLLAAYNTIGIRMASADAELASQAHEILDKRCNHCHGADGTNEGGFDYTTDLKKLIKRGMVVAGKPEQSKLLTRIISGDMPADDDMPAEETTLLRRWIESGAPGLEQDAPAREIVSPQQEFSFIEADLLRISAADRRFTRYFSLTHLANTGVADSTLDQHRQALSKVVNSLSWGNQVVPPFALTSSKSIFRIDLRDYQWTEATWNLIVDKSPYKAIYKDSASDFARRVTGTEHPCLRADWFVSTATVPPLYHDILQIPETEKELEELLGIDTKKNFDDRRVARAGFNGSAVSRNNRLLERHETQYGAYWKSYDFSGNSGDKNLFAHPLGPDGENGFEHDGGEIIFNLPNGMQGYMLADAAGNRIDKGPTAIVSDPNRPDRAVVNGLSCMGCHAKGIIPKSDQVRPATLKNLNLYSPNESQLILALYPKSEKMDELMALDSARFQAALRAADVQITKQEPVTELVRHFERELDVDLAAAEMGLTTEQFLRALEVAPDVAIEYGTLRTAGGTIQREAFIDNFRALFDSLGLQHETHFNQLNMRMLKITAGTFNMGSAQGDADGQADERNQHRVRITRSFRLAAHEVTVGQYQQFVDDTRHEGPYGYRFNPQTGRFVQNIHHDWRNPGFEQTDDHPVLNVSWEDAQAFCRWLSKKEGVKYRLPTEAEWEYACRAGSTSRFATSDTAASLEELGNVADQSLKSVTGFGERWNDGSRFTNKVGSYNANAFGLFDMHGNVWEWCQDRYDSNYYRQSPINDPQGPTSGQQRVARGGSWATPAANARSAERLGLQATDRNLLIGFRVVCEE